MFVSVLIMEVKCGTQHITYCRCAVIKYQMWITVQLLSSRCQSCLVEKRQQQ